MPRKAKKLGKKDRAEGETLAGFGVPVKDIAAIKGVHADTLRKHAKEELERGRAKAVAQVGRTALRMAASGKHPAMTAFFLKCQGGWSEHARPPEWLEPYLEGDGA